MNDVILSAVITTIGLVIVASISAWSAVRVEQRGRRVEEATEAARVEVADVKQTTEVTSNRQIAIAEEVRTEVGEVHALVDGAHTKLVDALLWMLAKMDEAGIALTASERSMLRDAAVHLTEPRISLPKRSTEQ